MKGFVLLAVAILAVTVSGQTPQRQQYKSSESNESSMEHSKKWKTSAITFEQYQANHEAYANQLSTDGIWLSWEVSDPKIPWDAVYAGYSPNDTLHVMRADHTEENGHYAGKFVGKWSPRMQLASISYNGKEYPKTHFEILLHNQIAWASKMDDRELIVNHDEVNGPLEYICRFESDFREYWTPGRLDANLRFCRLPNDGTEMVSAGYESLRKACSLTNSRNMDDRTNAPVRISQKQLEENPELYSDQLDGNGVWIYWNTQKTGAPPNAVLGGRNTNGPVFLMIAEHSNEHGVYVGRIPGTYYPNLKKGFIEYEGKEYTKEIFDILVHGSYNYVFEYEPTNTTQITIGGQYGFCMTGGGSGTIWHAGRLDLSTGHCVATTNGQVIVNKGGYRVLRRACS